MGKPIFRPSFGNRPDQLVGRQETIGRVMAGLESYPGSADRATLLTGQRGMGKTALLLEIADLAAAEGFVVARVTCGETMLDTIVEVLQRTGERFVRERKKPIKGFSAGALGFSVGLTFSDEAQRTFGFRVKLEMICERLHEADKRVLILVDEVDPAVGQMRTLVTTYQELVGGEADIAIVMAGLPSAVSGVLKSKTLTFLNRAQRIVLGPVSFPEVEAYYFGAFERAGLKIEDALVKRAAALTEGFPYLIQLVGYYLVKFARPQGDVNPRHLELAHKAARAELDEKVHRAMLAPLSDVDLVFLGAMAADGEASKVADLEARLGMSHGTFQTYRRRLIDSGVVTAPRRGELAFVLPTLVEYLRGNEADG